MIEAPLILIVDDETHILHVVSIKLKNAGFRIVTANDGEEGLAAAREHQPNLIITDYQMPFMTGLELCIALKEEEKTAHIPAMMLTARGFSLDKPYTEQTNIVALLSKPFSPREILTKVQSLIGHASDTEVNAG